MSEHLNKKIILGIDISGSYISSALIDDNGNSVVEGTFFKDRVDSKGKAEDIIITWIETMQKFLSKCKDVDNISGAVVTMPGPFLYDDGISVIEGTHKYDRLFGINIRKAIENSLLKDNNIPIVFANDAICFALGESISSREKDYHRIIAITLGTGLESAFIEDQQALEPSVQTPYAGILYKAPFRDGIAEDYISSKWIVKKYASLTREIIEAKEVVTRAMSGDKKAEKIYECLGRNLAEILALNIQLFNAECVVIGGNIALAHHLFLPVFDAVLAEKNIHTTVIISADTEISAMVDAAYYLKPNKQQFINEVTETNDWRRSLQPLIPKTASDHGLQPGDYDLYFFIEINDGEIFESYESLAAWIAMHNKIIIDGFVGNDLAFIMERLHEMFIKQSVNVLWYVMSAFEKAEDQIEKMIQPFF